MLVIFQLQIKVPFAIVHIYRQLLLAIHSWPCAQMMANCYKSTHDGSWSRWLVVCLSSLENMTGVISNQHLQPVYFCTAGTAATMA